MGETREQHLCFYFCGKIALVVFFFLFQIFPHAFARAEPQTVPNAAFLFSKRGMDFYLIGENTGNDSNVLVVVNVNSNQALIPANSSEDGRYAFVDAEFIAFLYREIVGGLNKKFCSDITWMNFSFVTREYLSANSARAVDSPILDLYLKPKQKVAGAKKFIDPKRVPAQGYISLGKNRGCELADPNILHPDYQFYYDAGSKLKIPLGSYQALSYSVFLKKQERFLQKQKEYKIFKDKQSRKLRIARKRRLSTNIREILSDTSVSTTGCDPASSVRSEALGIEGVLFGLSGGKTWIDEDSHKGGFDYKISFDCIYFLWITKASEPKFFFFVAEGSYFRTESPRVIESLPKGSIIFSIDRRFKKSIEDAVRFAVKNFANRFSEISEANGESRPKFVHLRCENLELCQKRIVKGLLRAIYARKDFARTVPQVKEIEMPRDIHFLVGDERFSNITAPLFNKERAKFSNVKQKPIYLYILSKVRFPDGFKVE